MSTSVTRRRFVTGALATGAAAAIPGAGEAQAAAGKSAREVDVAIVGAGLAGLTAARQFTAPGARCSCWRPATASAAGA